MAWFSLIGSAGVLEARYQPDVTPAWSRVRAVCGGAGRYDLTEPPVGLLTGAAGGRCAWGRFQIRAGVLPASRRRSDLAAVRSVADSERRPRPRPPHIRVRDGRVRRPPRPAPVGLARVPRRDRCGVWRCWGAGRRLMTQTDATAVGGGVCPSSAHDRGRAVLSVP